MPAAALRAPRGSSHSTHAPSVTEGLLGKAPDCRRRSRLPLQDADLCFLGSRLRGCLGLGSPCPGQATPREAVLGPVRWALPPAPCTARSTNRPFPLSSRVSTLSQPWPSACCSLCHVWTREATRGSGHCGQQAASRDQHPGQWTSLCKQSE